MFKLIIFVDEVQNLFFIKAIIFIITSLVYANKHFYFISYFIWNFISNFIIIFMLKKWYTRYSFFINF